jgi:hypothetical protein
MRRWVAGFGFIPSLVAGLSGNPGIAAGFAMAGRTMRTGARPRRHSAATQVSPNQSMPVARRVTGVSFKVPQRPPGQARRPSSTR